MSGGNVALNEPQTDGGVLAVTYPIYKDMFENNIVYAYRGIVSSDLVSHVLTIMDDTLEGHNEDKRLAKKISNVMVECLTNVYVDEDQLDKTTYDPQAMLLVKKNEGSYSIVTGNNIPNERVGEVKRLVDGINRMSTEELKELYMKRLSEEPKDSVGLYNLSIIDLARKSRNTLTYFFKYVNLDFTFFSLEAQISR